MAQTRNIVIPEQTVSSPTIVLNQSLQGKTVDVSYRKSGGYISVPNTIIDVLHGVIILNIPVLATGSYAYTVKVNKSTVLSGNLSTSSDRADTVNNNTTVGGETSQTIGSLIYLSGDVGSPADDDTIPISDKSSGSIMKKITWAAIRDGLSGGLSQAQILTRQL